MAIPEGMKSLFKFFTDAEPDITKSYKIERAVKESVKGHVLLNAMIKKSDTIIICGGREVSIRICTPLKYDENCQTALLFFHGGGWVTESIDTYLEVCMNLANFTGCKVIAVDYSLAPEKPFPYGLEDCYACARELILNPSAFGIDMQNIILIGDSAGGNLSAAVSLMARDRNEFKITKQILIYPALYNDHTENSPYKSIVENGTEYILTSKRLCDYLSLYATCEEDYNNPYFAPLLANDLSNQPETMIITAEFDPLRDEGEAYGMALKKAGNTAEIYRLKDTLHGFIALSPGIKHVKKAYELITEFVRKD